FLRPERSERGGSVTIQPGAIGAGRARDRQAVRHFTEHRREGEGESVTENGKKGDRPPEDIDPKRLDVATTRRRRRHRAKPEPSESLKAGRAKALARALKRPLSPGVMFEPVGTRGHVTTSPHADLELWELQLADAFGTRSSSVMKTFMGQLRHLVPEVWD